MLLIFSHSIVVLAKLRPVDAALHSSDHRFVIVEFAHLMLKDTPSNGDVCMKMT